MKSFEDFKALLARRQAERRMTDRALSAEAGLGHAAVWHLKHKASDISLTTAIKLLAAVGVTVTTERR